MFVRWCLEHFVLEKRRQRKLENYLLEYVLLLAAISLTLLVCRLEH
jgi:uncharacterized protein YpiB (UPF0302 family)